MYRDKPSGAEKNAEVFAADYLAAKRFIDDAALNAHVLQTLSRNLPVGSNQEPLQVLEVGGGIGTMLVRLVERKVLRGPVAYWLTDNDAAHLAAAKRYLNCWAKEHNFTLAWTTAQRGRLTSAAADVTIILDEIDIGRITQRAELQRSYDLLLAHGVLDLFDLSQVMGGLLSCLNQPGLAYFTCNFDGETIFYPELTADGEIIDHYHGSMENRICGASHTGRRLFAYLQNMQAEILAAGSSDWLIHPSMQGYSDAMKHFLQHIILLVEKELSENTKTRPEYTDWIRQRRQQIEDGTLCLQAKHLDMLARPQ